MHLAQVLPRLAKTGFDIVVHTLSGRGQLADRLEAGGVRVIVPSTAPARRGGMLGRALRALRACGSLARTISGWRPDVVHFFLPEAYLAGAPVAIFSGARRLAMSRRSLNAYQRRHPLLARLERLLHRRMDAVVGNSAAIVRELTAEGVDADRLHLIPNGVDLSRFGRPRVPSRGPLRFLTVANLIAYKGHADLLAAFALAAPELPDWQLRCVGRDDGLMDALQAQARDAGIGDKVLFLGSRADVPELLASSDVAILASHEEGFPNAVIEAMAAGLPVVATRVGGVPEAVEDGVTGLLVPPHDPQALAAALRRMAGDPAACARMGQAGLARASAIFAIEACVDRYRELYERLARD